MEKKRIIMKEGDVVLTRITVTKGGKVVSTKFAVDHFNYHNTRSKKHEAFLMYKRRVLVDKNRMDPQKKISIEGIPEKYDTKSEGFEKQFLRDLAEYRLSKLSITSISDFYFAKDFLEFVKRQGYDDIASAIDKMLEDNISDKSM